MGLFRALISEELRASWKAWVFRPDLTPALFQKTKNYFEYSSLSEPVNTLNTPPYQNPWIHWRTLLGLLSVSPKVFRDVVNWERGREDENTPSCHDQPNSGKPSRMLGLGGAPGEEGGTGRKGGVLGMRASQSQLQRYSITGKHQLGLCQAGSNLRAHTWPHLTPEFSVQRRLQSWPCISHAQSLFTPLWFLLIL